MPEPITYQDDDRLPEWQFGITNLDRRARRPGSTRCGRTNTWPVSCSCDARFGAARPAIVAFVGVSLYRAIFAKRGAIRLGLAAGAFEGAQVFVLPNPSGRNANFSYAEMLGAFRTLARVIKSKRPG